MTINQITHNKVNKHQIRQQTGRILIYVFCISVAVIILFPLFWSILTSFKPPAEAMAVPITFLPSRLDIGNYLLLNKYGVGVWQYIYNSSVTAIITVFGSIILSVLAGYGFSRFKFRGDKVLFLMLLAAMMIPFASILTPLFIMLGWLDLQNKLIGLALVYITFQLPFGVFVMRNAFAAVPKELEEAALLDGCTSVSMLYRVMLRLVLPGVVTVAIYAFLNSWNEFLAALIFMNQQDKFTLPILLTNVRSGLFGQINWGALQAGLTITIIPCIILFLLLQRYYMQGLMGGAVKG